MLEYRLWCHPDEGAPDIDGGNDYYYAFASHQEAVAFAETTAGAEEPLALVLQEEHIAEPERPTPQSKDANPRGVSRSLLLFRVRVGAAECQAVMRCLGTP